MVEMKFPSFSRSFHQNFPTNIHFTAGYVLYIQIAYYILEAFSISRTGGILHFDWFKTCQTNNMHDIRDCLSTACKDFVKIQKKTRFPVDMVYIFFPTQPLSLQNSLIFSCILGFSFKVKQLCTNQIYRTKLKR